MKNFHGWRIFARLYKLYLGEHNMIKFLSCVLLLCAIAIPLQAQFNYENNEFGMANASESYSSNQKSIIYVFYNSQKCQYTQYCPQAIELIESVYDQYFMNQYEFLIIDYYQDGESGFIYKYKLSSPVTMVLQAVEYGQPTAYIKFPALQNFAYDPESFKQNIYNQIVSFFSNI